MAKVSFDQFAINNFSCIEEAVIPLNAVDLCCIEGRVLNGSNGNLPDQIYQRSNGAGKSSIVEAFYFCLTGEFFDSDTTLGSVINRFTKSPVELVLLGEIEDTQFKIRRTISAKTAKSKPNHELEFMFGDQNIHEQTNSISQIQERINDFLGINPLLLLNSKIFGQGDISSFTKVNDRHKKIIIDNLVGIGVCDKIYKTSKTLLSQVTTQMTTINVEMMVVNKTLASTEEELDGLQRKHQSWEKEKVGETNVIHNKIMILSEEIKLDLNKIKEFDTAKSKIKYVDCDVSGLEQEQNKAEKFIEIVKNKLKDATKERNTHENEKSFCLGHLKKISDDFKKLSDVYSSDTSVCPTCHQELDQDNYEKLKVILSEQEAEINGKIDQLLVLIKQLSSKENNLNAALNELAAKVQSILTAIKSYKTAIENEKEFFNKIDGLKNKIEVREREKKLLEETIESTSKKESPYVSLIHTKQKQITEIKIGIKEGLDKIEELEKEQRYYNFIARAFDKDGIPQLISYDVLKILNKIFTKYKNQILGENFIAEYEMKQKKSNEEIHLRIVNPDGGEGYSRQSKGEKRKIDLCQMFTISDFAKLQNKCDLNVIWFDEIFSELDPYSCDVVLDIIKNCKVDSKFIITHKDLFKDEFKSKIFVEKRGHTSSISVSAV